VPEGGGTNPETAPEGSPHATQERVARESTSQATTLETPQPTQRRSRRQQGEKAENQFGIGGDRVFMTTESLLTQILGENHEWLVPEYIDSFFGTFLSALEEVAKDGDDLRTTHAVIATAIIAEQDSESNFKEKLHRSELPPVPTFWKDLRKHSLGQYFIQDANLELETLAKNDCWTVIDRAKAKYIPIPLKWVFTYKTNSTGYLYRCRSRIVVRGDLQQDDSVLSTYAATLAARSFRIAMAIAAHFDLEIKQFDVINAFINAKRDPKGQRVAVQLPDGFQIPGKCAELDRALYGLKDSPALWFKEFTMTLQTLKLISCKEEPCIYMDLSRKVFVIFYVDDIQFLYHKKDETFANELIDKLKQIYKLRDLGDVEFFLGVRVLRSRATRKLWLVHDSYIDKITTRFKLNTSNQKCPTTPLPYGTLEKSDSQATSSKVTEYQEKVGSVLYTAIMLRPDVAFAASTLSQFLTNPSQEHLNAVDWTIRYLYGTRFLGIQYGGKLTGSHIVIATDASFADNIETRRSSQGFIISLFGGLVVWKAARQDTVTTSTTEAELLGLSLTAKETMALKRLFQEIQLDLGELWTIYCNNQQTIRLVIGENERISTKLRHVDIQNMWLRQEYGKGSFLVEYLETNSMPADGLTKNLTRQKFEHFRTLLNLQDTRALIEKLN